MTTPVAVAKVGIGTPDAAAAINAYDPDLHATTTGDGSALTIRVVVDRRQQRGLPRGWARPTCDRQRDRQPTPEREATRMHSVRAHGPRRARQDRPPGKQRQHGPLRPPHRHGGRRQEDHTSLNGMPHRRAVPGQVRAAERANPDGGVPNGYSYQSTRRTAALTARKAGWWHARPPRGTTSRTPGRRRSGSRASGYSSTSPRHTERIS